MVTSTFQRSSKYDPSLGFPELQYLRVIFRVVSTHLFLGVQSVASMLRGE